MDVVNTAAWEGRTQKQTGGVSVQLAQQIHATMNAEGPPPLDGSLLPPLWHWCAFPPLTRSSDLAADGHPNLGDFLPPIHLSRRMWAGGALDFIGPLRVGDSLSRSSTIMRVEDKGTAETPMVFITVAHNIWGPQGLAVRERQTLVYLNIPEQFAPPKKRPMPAKADAKSQVDVNEAALFRFSAITFNAHRIHYDPVYTREVEHYPALVIHGPMQAMSLMQFAIREKGAIPSFFEFRGVYPMFLGKPLDMSMQQDEDGGAAMFAGQEGHQGTVAHAFWEGTV